MIKVVFLIFQCLTAISGQLDFALPSPQNFLHILLNDTTGELIDLVSDFSFDDITPEHISVTFYDSDFTARLVDVNSILPQINRKAPFKFLIHGWQETGGHDFIKDFMKSYHSIGITNIFGIDWSLHSKRSYIHSARGIKKIGELVAQYVMHIIKNNTKLLSNVHLIGHSLGAHVAAFAGKYIIDMTKGVKIGRITALDAAGPLFEFPVILPDHLRLTKGDADFVDSFHTNAGFLGFLRPFAHADYYINLGGPIQPGCLQPNLFEAFVCSHAKSYMIYNETITSKNYLATPCRTPLEALMNLCSGNKRVTMGEHGVNNNGEFFIDVDANNLPTVRRLG